jgi:hypothetical protein
MGEAAVTALNTATEALFLDGKFVYSKEKLLEWKDAFDTALRMDPASLTPAQMDAVSDSGEKVMDALKIWRRTAAAAAGGRRRTRSTKGLKSRHRRHRGTRRR